MGHKVVLIWTAEEPSMGARHCRSSKLGFVGRREPGQNATGALGGDSRKGWWINDNLYLHVLIIYVVRIEAGGQYKV
jgi:hypothetical protein